MFQTPPPNNDNIMQPTTHFNDSQRTIIQDAPDSSISSSGSSDASNSMRSNVQYPGISSPNSSGITTPVSTRSSLSYESTVSSSFTSSRPKRSSMKSNLKSTPFSSANVNGRSSPPTVRFADPEPISKPRPKPTPMQQHHLQQQRNGIPNPLLQYQHRPASSVSCSSSSRYSFGPQPYTTQPPHGVPTPQLGQLQHIKPRSSQRFSAPVQPAQPDPKWSDIPLPVNFSPPTPTPGTRITSFQSAVSNLSTQSAPATLQVTPTTVSSQGQYNPLEHYIPCLYTGCKVHYTPAHAGFTYYLPQGSYSLSRHHGYCHRHATKELKETNALCKREWESSRQNAGRKTLGQIASEFDAFLEGYREDRGLKDTELQRRQKRIVLGAANSTNPGQIRGKTQDDVKWDWRYTPRQCTKASCSSSPYSPFANHLFTYYRTPSSSSSSFLPLSTLCPSCSASELSAFEHSITEKWTSRCGWEENEWNEWFDNAVNKREMEREFWEKAQERVVREKGPARWIQRVTEQEEAEERKGVERATEKKKGLWKRLFGSVM